MSHAAIAERYARAIFDLAVETSQVGPMSDAIRSFAETYEANPELQRVLSHGADAAQRDAILKDVGARLMMSPNALNAVRLMAERRRLPAIADVSRILTRLADDKAGIVRATVTSAKPLSEEYYASLARELEQRTQRKVLLERKQDPALLAGVVTRIGDHTLDGSVRGRLSALEAQLLSST
ncbi:MAG TPA: ATP synthase F1 subunit delta [Polyangiaceae bacterium]|nr:ATP synthase F1 subunit delta [Polyangiaceae bacterium]